MTCFCCNIAHNPPCLQELSQTCDRGQSWTDEKQRTALGGSLSCAFPRWAAPSHVPFHGGRLPLTCLSTEFTESLCCFHIGSPTSSINLKRGMQ
eukprot:6200295-Pleurochrysis_carterae.AAC.1